jgi:cytochrome c oxidase subunit 2
MVRAARSSLPAFRWGCSSSDGFCFISFYLSREDPLADNVTNPLRRQLSDGIVPEDEVAHTEDRWLTVVLSMLGVMMAIIVVTGAAHALHPPSNVETIDPTTLHLGGEFAESNLGTAVEPDGSVTVRMIAQQYSFVPNCTQVPIDTPVKFRITSTDVIHGFLLPGTNVNTMVVPGYVAEVRTTFNRPGVYNMPCDEFCGYGHHGMWARVEGVPRNEFPGLAPAELLKRTSCAKQ